MPIDFRYHLTTMVAIFLALACGILVGSSFIAGSSIKGLEQEFGKLRAENRQQVRNIEMLNEQIAKHVEFQRASAPMLVYGRLSGRNIAVIQTGDYSEATRRTKSILEEAGAKVVSVTTLSAVDEESSRDHVVRAVEVVTGNSDHRDPLNQLLEIVAKGVVAGTNPEALGILEDKGLLSRAGEYNRRVAHVVLVGGATSGRSKKPQHIDLPLIDKLEEAGVATIVGVEPFDVGTSYMPSYHRKQIPTVDNVDQHVGQVGLVYAMAGEDGNFGVKKSADKVAPDYLESGTWRFGFRR